MMNNQNMNEELPDGYKMTELGPLPEEWRVVRLGEVATINAGGSAPQGESYFLSGKHPFVRVQHLDVDSDYVRRWDLITDEAVKHYRLQKFPAGTIVFPKSGAAIRLEKRAILPLDAYIVSHLCAVLPANEEMDSRFLFYALRSRRFAEGKAEGYPVLNLSEIREVLIPLPPLPEQRAIAHVLRTVQEAREKTEAVIQAAKELKKSMMKHLFTYGPVPPSEADSVPLKETEIGMVPEEWEVVRLGDVSNIIMGQSPPGSTYNTKGEGIPFLQGKAEFGKIHPQHVKFTTDPKKIAPKNSVLISVRAPVGDVNIADIEYCIGRGLASISLIKGDNKFLFYAMTFLKPSIEKEGTGSTFKAINKSKLEDVEIPLPPLPVQQKITSILSAVDEKIHAEENKKKALEELFKTLLYNLMTAKIRVNNLKVEI